ncbi:peptidase m48 ste24p : : TPR_1: TPR_1 [Gemmata massiliana]|uniref:Peptidase m48 ste24p:: TPR_1: TPR_1 n=1 Tax=Gemmata massiliana TaxID=1210884 RepID=A0A6P2CW56_9BACT|nr:tetratricopeptide repeat protein [Gemmata massiliana]VTR93169.1 peptidase m48 ste24p : : TPR_1: TPR_1 [Gemmata massiliana]
MTPWHRNEYILKGLFFGLWAFFALQVPPSRDDAWKDIFWVLGWVCTGLAVGLILGVGRLVRRGVKPWENLKAFPLLVLLESPQFIYGGVMIGLMCGIMSGRELAQPWAQPLAELVGLTWDDIKHTPPVSEWLSFCAFGGAVLGFGLYRMRQMEDGRWRFLTGIGVAAAFVYLASEYILEIKVPDPTDATKSVSLFESAASRVNLGIYLLLGLPFFYLLTFCGEAEESEVEIMTFCGVLGIALHLIGLGTALPGSGAATPFLVPIVIYFVYATRVLPGLRVFKHALRGFSYMNLGQLTLAIRFFRRALELNPNSELANEGMHQLHNSITLATLERHPDLVEELDFKMCLDRATGLLMVPPTAAASEEAARFLDLVEQKKPVYLARVDYLRVIALIHAKQYDHASEALARLLSPETPGYHPTVRSQILFDSWFLALDGPKGVVERIGWPELNKPGRRMEAIGAVERKLAADAGNEKAKEYRNVLYTGLQEKEFVAAVAVAGAPKDFNYDYVEQLGHQLADDNDPERRERGLGYLRIAGRGLLGRAPAIFKKLADVSEKYGDPHSARGYTEQIKLAGRAFGPRNFAKDQREIYLNALRKLAALAEAEGDVFKAEADAADASGDAAGREKKDAEARPYYESAIADLQLYRDDGGGAVLEAYRKIAEMHGKMRDALNAVINTAAALEYSSSDADLIQKRDTYYYSVTVERLTRAKENVGKWFDVGYCVRKAMAVLNRADTDADLLEWATHLARLAKVIEPTSNRVRLVEARCLLRRGERDAGLQLLEDVREGQKGSGDEEEAWYNATRLLGQLYLEELNRPELAVRAYLDYKDYHKSGADTLFNIARCYEAMNDPANAIKYYNAVTVYEEHPKYWDAKEALRRLGKG